MAIYEFVCEECKILKEERRLMKDRNDPCPCPKCGKNMDRLIGNPGLVFKGKGFYTTDVLHQKDMSKQAKKDKKARQEGKQIWREF